MLENYFIKKLLKADSKKLDKYISFISENSVKYSNDYSGLANKAYQYLFVEYLENYFKGKDNYGVYIKLDDSDSIIGMSKLCESDPKLKSKIVVNIDNSVATYSAYREPYVVRQAIEIGEYFWLESHLSMQSSSDIEETWYLHYEQVNIIKDTENLNSVDDVVDNVNNSGTFSEEQKDFLTKHLKGE